MYIEKASARTLKELAHWGSAAYVRELGKEDY